MYFLVFIYRLLKIKYSCTYCPVASILSSRYFKQERFVNKIYRTDVEGNSERSRVSEDLFNRKRASHSES